MTSRLRGQKCGAEWQGWRAEGAVSESDVSLWLSTDNEGSFCRETMVGKLKPERLLAAESRRSEASQDGRWAEGVDSREGREPRIEDGVFAYDDREAEQLDHGTGIVSSIVTLPGATTPDGLHPQPFSSFHARGTLQQSRDRLGGTAGLVMPPPIIESALARSGICQRVGA